MKTCFVIQPFDRGAYDRRFDEVLVPAIRGAGMAAYRTDRDPSTDVPIDTIRDQIRDAYACVADITEDNANIWFEVGYSLACQKRLCLICSRDRKAQLPFDIRNRSVIFYDGNDPQALTTAITARLRAILNDDDVAYCNGSASHLPFISRLGNCVKSRPRPSTRSPMRRFG